MNYKGYEGIVEYDDDAAIFHGEVVNTRDVITFQGTSVSELQQAFKDSVDDYIEFCRLRGEEPEKPFSGTFVLRMSPQLHRQIVLEAKRKGKSLNAYVIGKLQPEAGAAAFDKRSQRNKGFSRQRTKPVPAA
jgi:predicted HicB family RNase H-like nuclease